MSCEEGVLPIYMHTLELGLGLDDGQEFIMSATKQCEGAYLLGFHLLAS